MLLHVAKYLNLIERHLSDSRAQKILRIYVRGNNIQDDYTHTHTHTHTHTRLTNVSEVNLVNLDKNINYFYMNSELKQMSKFCIYCFRETVFHVRNDAFHKRQLKN